MDILGKLNGLDLFTRYAGISIGLEEWVRPVAYCEIERYAQGILLSRMEEGKLPVAPIWDDVRTLDGFQFRGRVDIIYGGFPCQDISVAGNGKGLAGKRSGLFYEVCSLVKEINPRFVFLENVPAIRTKGLSRVISEFTDLGYDCRWTSVSAKEVGADHNRKRWFLLAHAKHDGLDGSKTLEGTGQTVQHNSKGQDETSELEGGNTQGVLSTYQAVQSQGSGEVEPYICRTTNDDTFRVDRIKALGNGVVPKQVKEAFERLMGL